MKRCKKQFCLRIFLVLVVFLSLSGNGSAEEKERYFELGLGGGINLEGINTRQILLAPAIDWKIKDQKSLRFRLEGNLELIDDKEHLSFIGGIAPFLRLLLSEMNPRPFFEIGAGANLTSRDEIGGRNLGGSFLFSLMGGAGFELMTKGKLISLSYRFRHLSNGGMYSRNQSVNFQYFMLSLGF